MFNPSNPNPFTLATMQRQQDIDNAVAYFIDLWHDDYDINDDKVQKMVFKRYGLNELSAAEEREIIRKVEAAIV
jgi:2-hydroxychromene-2-carboxylate isomerase